MTCPSMPLRWFAVVVTLLVGCGQSGTEPTAVSPADGRAGDTGTSAATFTRADLVDCAGFTVESAASILNVAPAALAAETGWSEELGGQWCHYWSPESLIGPGIQFLLEVEDTEAAAILTLARLRENAPSGEAAIRAAMGQPSDEVSLIELEGVGDEAFWNALTSGVILRVGNATASIEVSPSRELVQGQERAEIELERRVAEQIARRLAALR